MFNDEGRGQGLTELVYGRRGKEWEVEKRPRSTGSGWWNERRRRNPIDGLESGCGRREET